jgi:hypothetical protein
VQDGQGTSRASRISQHQQHQQPTRVHQMRHAQRLHCRQWGRQPPARACRCCCLSLVCCILHGASSQPRNSPPTASSMLINRSIVHHSLPTPSHLARRRLLCRLATRLAGSGGGLTRRWCKCCVPLAHKPPTASHAALNPHGSLLQPPAISHIFACAAPALPAGLPCSLTRSFPPPPPITLLVPT